MYVLRRSPLLFVLLLLTACVTINVYFPAAAAEAAADRIIKDVYGTEVVPAPSPKTTEPTSQREQAPWSQRLLGHLLAWVPVAQAAGVDIDIQSPGIQRLQAAMAERHQQLAPFYASGAVGMTHNGEIVLRDLNAVPLKDRKRVSQLVGSENQDRTALYAEIARANGHPEWAADIRETFARRWVGNAPAGWWHQNAAGAWSQK